MSERILTLNRSAARRTNLFWTGVLTVTDIMRRAANITKKYGAEGTQFTMAQTKHKVGQIFKRVGNCSHLKRRTLATISKFLLSCFRFKTTNRREYIYWFHEPVKHPVKFSNIHFYEKTISESYRAFIVYDLCIYANILLLLFLVRSFSSE